MSYDYKVFLFSIFQVCLLVFQNRDFGKSVRSELDFKLLLPSQQGALFEKKRNLKFYTVRSVSESRPIYI